MLPISSLKNLLKLHKASPQKSLFELMIKYRLAKEIVRSRFRSNTIVAVKDFSDIKGIVITSRRDTDMVHVLEGLAGNPDVYWNTREFPTESERYQVNGYYNQACIYGWTKEVPKAVVLSEEISRTEQSRLLNRINRV